LLIEKELSNSVQFLSIMYVDLVQHPQCVTFIEGFKMIID